MRAARQEPSVLWLWRWPAAALIAVVVGSGLPGCRSDGGPEVNADGSDARFDRIDAKNESIDVAEAIRAFPKRALDAAVPPGLNAEDVEPLTSAALERAHLTLGEVRRQLSRPVFLPEPDETTNGAASSEEEANADVQDNASADDELPLATQRLYAAARQQMLEGRSAEAVKLLEAALRVSPNEPAVLRLLASATATLGNRVRAVEYLRRVVTADPGDVESLVLLGRFLVEAGDVDGGLAALLAGLADETSLAGVDPSLPLLARFYLAAGLKRGGYFAASAEQMRTVLESSPTDLRPSRYGAELLFLNRRQQANFVALGDLHSRLDEPLAARQLYAQAEQSGAGGSALVRRIVYTDLRLGRLEPARQRILALVERSEASPAALSLVEYAVAQGLPAEPMVESLRDLRRRSAEPDAVTLALAAALPREPAVSLLAEHLDEQPADTRVFERYLALRLEEATDAQRAEAIRRTAAAIDADPDAAARRAGALLALSPDKSALPPAFALLPEDQRARASVVTLEAVVLAELDDTDTAHALLDRALASPDAPALARIEKARLLALAGDYAGAEALIDTLDADLDDPRLASLRVGVLLNLDRRDEALALLDELVETNPTDIRFVIQKARLLATMGRAEDAERTLLDAIGRQPKQEAYYAQLLDLYDTVGGQLEDYPNNYNRLVRRMLQQIPATRTAQLTIATIKEAERDFERAEQILDGLLRRNPDDRDAKLVLIDVYRNTNRVDKAGAILEQLLVESPDDREVLDAGRRFYRMTQNDAKRDELDERWLRQQEPSLMRNVALSRLLARSDRPEEALRLLDEAAEFVEGDPALALRGEVVQLAAELPLDVAEPRLRAIMEGDPAPELLRAAGLTLADHYYRAGREADFDELMLDLLGRFPNDPVLNNQLGYLWADAGRNLDEAERMILIAHAADPDESMYLDSLGWVMYKQGRFDEALVWLKRATQAPQGDHPVIVDHLADTYYRLGRVDDAVELWRSARDDADHPRFADLNDPELASLAERAEAKLEAVEAGDGEVPVAQVPRRLAQPTSGAKPERFADDEGDAAAPVRDTEVQVHSVPLSDPGGPVRAAEEPGVNESRGPVESTP